MVLFFLSEAVSMCRSGCVLRAFVQMLVPMFRELSDAVPQMFWSRRRVLVQFALTWRVTVVPDFPTEGPHGNVRRRHVVSHTQVVLTVVAVVIDS